MHPDLRKSVLNIAMTALFNPPPNCTTGNKTWPGSHRWGLIWRRQGSRHQLLPKTARWEPVAPLHLALQEWQFQSADHNKTKPVAETCWMPFAPSLLAGSTTSKLATTRLRLRPELIELKSPRHAGQTSWRSFEQESTKETLPSICFSYLPSRLESPRATVTRTRALAKCLAILGCALSQITPINAIHAKTQCH